MHPHLLLLLLLSSPSTTLCNSPPNPNSSPKTLISLLQTLKHALFKAKNLSSLLHSTPIIETQRSSLQDCQELHHITISCLKKISRVRLSLSRKKLAFIRTCLSAALTNRATCIEGLTSASGVFKQTLISSVEEAYEPVRRAIALLPMAAAPGAGRRLSSFRSWLSQSNGRILQSSNSEEYDPNSVLTVAKDGSGNFTTIREAIGFAPNNSADRTIVIIKAGVYEENVEVPGYKTNLVFLGDGSDVSIIRGNRSVRDGWTTFRSATVAISGEGFLARDIAIENIAGPEKGQAVALRVNADLSAFYHCTFTGYQDTLYVHSFRQFYRECSISGTVDFIFGNSAVVFQGCTILPRRPLLGQFNAITAQGRDDPNENTGISIQNCTILPSSELSGNGSVKTFLGRPWRPYSRTVFMKSYIDGFVDPAGWREWNGDDKGLDTLYYGEYANIGMGASVDKRVSWLGHHLMTYEDALKFGVDFLIDGDGWLDTTSFPFDEGL